MATAVAARAHAVVEKKKRSPIFPPASKVAGDGKNRHQAAEFQIFGHRYTHHYQDIAQHKAQLDTAITIDRRATAKTQNKITHLPD